MPVFFGYDPKDPFLSHAAVTSTYLIEEMTENPDTDLKNRTANLWNNTYNCLGHACSNVVSIYFISFCGFSF